MKQTKNEYKWKIKEERKYEYDGTRENKETKKQRNETC